MTVITVMHTQNYQHSFFGKVSLVLSRISLCAKAELSLICKTNVGMCEILIVFFKNNIFILMLYSSIYIRPSYHKIVGTVCTAVLMDGHLPVFPYTIHLCSVLLLCVERSGLIAYWAKLVFLHLGEQSELGANARWFHQLYKNGRQASVQGF